MKPYITALLHKVGRKVLGVVALMVALNGLEGIGLLMLLPMLGVLGLATGSGQRGAITTLVVSLLHAVGLPHSLVAILGVYILVISVHAVLVRCHTILSAALQHSFVQALSQRLYTAISYTRWEFFARSGILSGTALTQRGRYAPYTRHTAFCGWRKLRRQG